MPSTTATQLASTRRKLRLAHHRRAAPSASANHEVSGSPAPSPTLTAGSSAGTPSPTSLSAAAGSTARPLAEPRGTPARGRSRRSRAVTRRGPEAVGESTTAAAADLRNPLNLPAAPSVDSDDNGTCFNSIGTTTPRQPSPRHAAPQRPINGEHHAGSRPYQPRLDDGDNSRTEASGRGRLVPAKTRGRRGGKDGTLSPLHEHGAPVPADSKVTKGSRGRAAGGSRRGESIWDHPEELVSHPNNNARSHRGVGAGGDNASAAYSEFDQDGNASYRSASVYSGKPTGGQRYPARGGRGGASLPAAGGCEFLPPATGETGEGGASVESSRYDEGTGFGNSLRAVRKSLGGEAATTNNGEEGEGEEEEEALLNRPHVKAALGVGAAATLGAIVLGPVGLLVGAASVGIGMGVMQIPEEQRTHVRHRASASFAHAREVACDVSDQLNTGCARYTGTDPKEVMEKVVPEEILEHVDACCHAVPEEGENGNGRGRGRSAGGGAEDGHSIVDAADVRSLEEGGSPLAHAARLVGDAFGEEPPQHPSSPNAAQSAAAGGGGDRTVGATEPPGAVADGADVGRRAACGRPGRVVPLGQIHSLRPSLQPRAWLDVMASAHTGRDDKNEAMQEVLILAKDKEISRWFLEEGILDSLMCILSGYFRNYSAFLRNEQPLAVAADAEVPEPFASFQPGGPAFRHARLAANCCVALGKAHCAAVHTEGDLLLMSAYSRGSVPVERQLAQMLFEVPHHMKAPPPPGGGGMGGEGPQPPQGEAEFTLTELSMQQAEDLASSIKALDDGKIDV